MAFLRGSIQYSVVTKNDDIPQNRNGVPPAHAEQVAAFHIEATEKG